MPLFFALNMQCTDKHHDSSFWRSSIGKSGYTCMVCKVCGRFIGYTRMEQQSKSLSEQAGSKVKEKDAHVDRGYSFFD